MVKDLCTAVGYGPGMASNAAETLLAVRGAVGLAGGVYNMSENIVNVSHGGMEHYCSDCGSVANASEKTFVWCAPAGYDEIGSYCLPCLVTLLEEADKGEDGIYEIKEVF